MISPQQNERTLFFSPFDRSGFFFFGGGGKFRRNGMAIWNQNDEYGIMHNDWWLVSAFDKVNASCLWSFIMFKTVTVLGLI